MVNGRMHSSLLSPPELGYVRSHRRSLASMNIKRNLKVTLGWAQTLGVLAVLILSPQSSTHRMTLKSVPEQL